MAQEMSFAQALNEAKQVILQLSGRVKADAEKIRAYQQTIVDQSATLADNERRLKEQGATLEEQVEQIRQQRELLERTTSARDQLESVNNRQGQRIEALQGQCQQMEGKFAELDRQLGEIVAERDALRTQLPSSEDEAALAAMAALLAKKSNASARIDKASSGQDESNEADEPTPSMRLVGRDHAAAA